MGHCEMLLAVAGLSESEVRERTRKLANGTWAAFPPEERAAYAYARKMSLAPASVTDADVATPRNTWVVPLVGQWTSTVTVAPDLPRPIVCCSGLAPKLLPLVTCR